MKRRQISILVLIIVLLLPAMSAATGANSNWEKKFFPGNKKEYHMPSMYYWVYTPENMRAGLPLVIYLHSSSGVANKALRDYLPAHVVDGTIPSPDAIILVPQLPTFDYNAYWDFCVNSVDAIIEEVIENYEPDTSRVSLVGYSLGGITVFDLAHMHPERYTRILSVCGRVSHTIINNLNVNPEAELLVITADKDIAVNSSTAVTYVDVLTAEGYKANHISYDMTHQEVGIEVFNDEGIWKWIWLVPEEDQDTD